MPDNLMKFNVHFKDIVSTVTNYMIDPGHSCVQQ